MDGRESFKSQSGQGTDLFIRQSGNLSTNGENSLKELLTRNLRKLSPVYEGIQQESLLTGEKWLPEIELRFSSYGSIGYDKSGNPNLSSTITDTQFANLVRMIEQLEKQGVPVEHIFQNDQVINRKIDRPEYSRGHGLIPESQYVNMAERTSKTGVESIYMTKVGLGWLILGDYPIKISIAKEKYQTEPFPEREGINRGEIPNLFMSTGQQTNTPNINLTRTKTRYHCDLSNHLNLIIYPDQTIGLDRTKPIPHLHMIGFIIDLTRVEIVDPTGKDPLRTEFEFEVELQINLPELFASPNWNSVMQILAHHLEILIKTAYQTQQLYTINDWNRLLEDYSKMTEVKDQFDSVRGQLSDRFLFQARNLHLRDMVDGGLFPSNRYPKGKSNVASSRITYTLTYKADGLRKLLIIGPSGIWLVFPPMEANLLFSWDQLSSKIDPRKIFYACIEGELIPPEKRINYNPSQPYNPKQPYYLFLAFDIVYSSLLPLLGGSEKLSGESVRMSNLLIRHQAISQVITYLSNLSTESKDQPITPLGVPRYHMAPGLYIHLKDFYPFNTRDQLIRLVEQMQTRIFQNDPSLIYLTDGYVITPIETPYLSYYLVEPQKKRPDKLYLNQRQLSRVPDICKLKFGAENTIDLAIVRLGEQIRLYGSSGAYLKPGESPSLNEHYTEFVGTEDHPFDPTSMLEIDIQDEDEGEIREINRSLRDIPSFRVGEFYWDNQRNLLRFKQLRTNKKFPNRIDYAIDNWSMIFESLDLWTLLGRDIRLMRHYHNHLKRGLFDLVSRPDLESLTSTDLNRKDLETLFEESKALASSDRISRNNQPGQVKRTNLLDLGFGRGGDWYKMKDRFEKIVAVEPNQTNLAEFLQRQAKLFESKEAIILTPDLSNLSEIDRDKTKLLIIQTGAENTPVITKAVQYFIGGKVNVVSTMLSMSFFWLNPTSLQQVLETIRENLDGYLVGLTIDGFATNQLVNPEMFGIGTSLLPKEPLPLTEELLKSIDQKTGQVTAYHLKRNGPTELLVKIYGSILEASVDSVDNYQHEGLVFLDDLLSVKDDQNQNQNLFQSIFQFQANGRPLSMSPLERQLSQLYRGFIFKTNKMQQTPFSSKQAFPTPLQVIPIQPSTGKIVPGTTPLSRLNSKEEDLLKSLGNLNISGTTPSAVSPVTSVQPTTPISLSSQLSGPGKSQRIRSKGTRGVQVIVPLPQPPQSSPISQPSPTTSISQTKGPESTSIRSTIAEILAQTNKPGVASSGPLPIYGQGSGQIVQQSIVPIPATTMKQNKDRTRPDISDRLDVCKRHGGSPPMLQAYDHLENFIWNRQPIKSSWLPKAYRFASGGDGSCLIHSILLAGNMFDYRNNLTYQRHSQIATTFRLDIVGWLTQPNVSFTNYVNQKRNPLVMANVDQFQQYENLYANLQNMGFQKYLQDIINDVSIDQTVLERYPQLNQFKQLHQGLVDAVAAYLLKDPEGNLDQALEPYTDMIKIWPLQPIYSNYDTLSYGTLKVISREPSYRELAPYAFLDTLKQIIGGCGYLGDEVLQILSININHRLVLVAICANELVPFERINWERDDWPFIIVGVLPGHYETIGVQNPDGSFELQFTNDSPVKAMIDYGFSSAKILSAGKK